MSCVVLIMHDCLCSCVSSGVLLIVTVCAIQVVEQSSGSQLGDELKIEKMVDKLCGELVTTSKHTATGQIHMTNGCDKYMTSSL